MVSVLAIHLIFRIWAAQACHSLAEARNSGTLGFDVSTPLTTSEIIQGQFSRSNVCSPDRGRNSGAGSGFSANCCRARIPSDVFRFFLMGVILA